MKLAIATVAVLVCLCGMKGVRADDDSYYYGAGPYSGGYSSMGGYSGSYGKMGYGMGGYSGYGKGGYGGLSGYGGGYSGYGKKHYTGYGKKGGHIIDETTILHPVPMAMPIAGVPYGAAVRASDSDGGLFGGDNQGLGLLALLFVFLILFNNNNTTTGK